MSGELFGNQIILDWLKYFMENTTMDLERVKILDITKRNRNLIPTIESNECVLVFTEAGHPEIFYRMWNVGLGECDVWYNPAQQDQGDDQPGHRRLRRHAHPEPQCPQHL